MSDTSKPIIKVGAGKGKLLGVTNQFLRELGLKELENNRVLVHKIEAEKYILEVTLLRWEDIKQYANDFDLIIFGSDQWLENGKKSMIALKHYEQANCRLSLLVPEEQKDQPIRYFLDRKVATGYPELAKSYMGISEKNIVKMTGSVEASISLGWADSIFDIVESGETAKVNGLVEKKVFVKFGAVLATTKPEKIAMFKDLGILVEKHTKRKIIAFDGIDGSGKSTLAKHFVQTGLGDNNPIVLVTPYSGYIGVTAQPLLDAGNCMDWATIIGQNHWRPTLDVNMVYDRAILTCLTELIKDKKSDKEIKEVIDSWKPLPDKIIVCRAPVDVLLKRLENRKERDIYDDRVSLRQYVELYQAAIKKLKEFEVIDIIVVNTDEEMIKTIKKVEVALNE